MPKFDTDIPSPVLENKDSSLLNTTLNDTDLLNDTLDGASYSETKKIELSHDEIKTAPSTPKKPTAQNSMKAKDIDAWIASKIMHNTIYSFNKSTAPESKNKNTSYSEKFLSLDSKINFDKNDDFTRYSLEQISNLFPTDIKINTLVARFVVVAKLNNDLEMELLLSRAGTDLDKSMDAMSHAQLAGGKEDYAECFSAGEIHFSKKNGAWLIDSINNQTGHFRCVFEALHMPINMLLAKKELWDDVVTIGQGTNSQKPGEKPTFEVITSEFKVNKSSQTDYSLAFTGKEFTSKLSPLSPAILFFTSTKNQMSNSSDLALSFSPVIPTVTLLDSEVDVFGSPKRQATNNPQSLYPSIPPFFGFKSQATDFELHATSQPRQQIDDLFTSFPPLSGVQSSHLSAYPPLPMPLRFGINATVVKSSKLHDASQQSVPITNNPVTSSSPVKRESSARSQQRSSEVLSQNKTESVWGLSGRHDRDRNYDKTASINSDASSMDTLFSPIRSSNSNKVSVVSHHAHNKTDNNIMNDDFSLDFDCDADCNSSTVMSRPA